MGIGAHWAACTDWSRAIAAGQAIFTAVALTATIIWRRCFGTASDAPAATSCLHLAVRRVPSIARESQ